MSDRLSTRLGWRALPLAAVVVGGVALTLAGFARLVAPYLAVDYDARLEVGMVVGQVLFQWVVLARRTWSDRFEYALVVLAVSAFGSVLLWPLLVAARHAVVTPSVAAAYFFAVVAVMFASHAWLLKRARLPRVLSATWVLYRLGLLVLLVKR